MPSRPSGGLHQMPQDATARGGNAEEGDAVTANITLLDLHSAPRV